MISQSELCHGIPASNKGAFSNTIIIILLCRTQVIKVRLAESFGVLAAPGKCLYLDYCYKTAALFSEAEITPIVTIDLLCPFDVLKSVKLHYLILGVLLAFKVCIVVHNYCTVASDNRVITTHKEHTR